MKLLLITVAIVLAQTSALKVETNTVQADLESVVIGSQTWSSKNLDVTTFVNGDVIPQATTQEEWEAFAQANEPAWCYPFYNETNGDEFGKLFNHHALTDSRSLIPKGWKLPSDEDWKILRTFLDPNGKENSNVAGGKLKSANESHWDTWGHGSQAKMYANNSTNFSAVGAGQCTGNGWFSGDTKSITGFWSSTHSSRSQVYYYSLSYGNEQLERWWSDVDCGKSVRLIKE